ncbi:MAG: hypothetical protein ABIZ91_00730 [Gemmatimonadaceae bacterium]
MAGARGIHRELGVRVDELVVRRIGDTRSLHPFAMYDSVVLHLPALQVEEVGVDGYQRHLAPILQARHHGAHPLAAHALVHCPYAVDAETTLAELDARHVDHPRTGGTKETGVGDAGRNGIDGRDFVRRGIKVRRIADAAPNADAGLRRRRPRSQHTRSYGEGE